MDQWDIVERKPDAVCIKTNNYALGGGYGNGYSYTNCDVLMLISSCADIQVSPFPHGSTDSLSSPL